ncbi:MAG: hypothetical protein JST11_13870 [Acidobacteria bacterium]|nr:hypothetical protein [Acidobacteriota bacterium]
MRLARRRVTFALLALAARPDAIARVSDEAGSWIFQTYSAKDYNASPQNWAIAQGRTGVMYFGNTDGVLEFDGVSWRTIRLSNKSFARSLAVDRRGTVYVGGVGEFGLLRADATGSLQYVSLLPRIPSQFRQFADVWRVLPTPAGLYFSTYSRIFRLNPDGSIKVWSPQTRFGRAFTLAGGLYVKTPEKGLERLEGDEWVPVPGGQQFGNLAVEAGVDTTLGPLVATLRQSYRLTPSGIDPFPTPFDSYFSKNPIFTAQILNGGVLAVGTRTGGVVLMTAQGRGDRILTKDSDGLFDNYIPAIFQDQSGAVWLAGSNGIARFAPALTRFNKADGLLGDVEVVERRGPDLFVGTTLGLFRLAPKPGVRPRFEKVAGLDLIVYSLLPHADDLLAGSDAGVWLISGGNARRILPDSLQQAVLDMSASRKDLAMVYAAGKAGVFALRKKGSSWEKASAITSAGQEFRSVVEDEDGRVWATSQDSIWRIDFRQTPPVAERFTAKQGVPAGWKNARRLQGHITFATEKGLKRYSESSRNFIPDGTLGDQNSNGSRDVYNVFEDGSGNVWVTGKGYHELLVRQPNGSFKAIASPLLQSHIGEIYGMHLDEDGTAWASGDEFVLYRWDPTLAGDSDRNFTVLTRRVQVTGEKQPLYDGDGPVGTIRLPFKSNDLRFEFAAPFFEDPAAVQYQVRLEGSDRAWRPWSSEPHHDYNSLSEGSYRFHVRARSPHGAMSEQASFTFSVLPPWYRTVWAYVIYFVFGGFGVWGIVRLRTRQLEEEKRKLEVIVEERTVEIREQRDEIQLQEKKSRELLLNILPVKVADELKATGSVQPVGFDDVTVCFTDFVGFTLSSEKLPPGKLVDSLNEYFTAFDEIIARYGLEKLKTIGDSYMFVSGLPVLRKSHAVDAVLAAMEMTQVVRNLAANPAGTKWGIRVGLHSGPVVAGVVGIRKFAFDIWGNTVNFAARMESSGVPGNVNMSERTQSLLHGLIETEFRGDVKIKEGRFLPMYLARGPAVAGEAEFARLYEREFGETLKSFPRNVAEVAQR